MSTYQQPLLRRWHLTDELGITFWGLLALLALTVIGIFAAVGATTIYASRAIGRTTCRNWSAATGYPSKFVILNWADTGTCLAQAPNGRWVLNTKVLTFTGQKP